MNKVKLPGIVAAVLFVALCILESSIHPLPGAKTLSSKSSSLYALAGEFRTVAANLLWIKADAYHHEYLEKNTDWTANKDLIDLLRFIVDLDPHFEEAYASGFYIYMNGYKDQKRAKAFLGEGLQNNPRSWDLHRLAALMYALEYKDYTKALEHAYKSFACSHDSFEKRITARLIVTLRERKKSTQPAPPG